jgi:hypothetical protein
MVMGLKGKIFLLFIMLLIAIGAIYASIPPQRPTIQITRLYGVKLKEGDIIPINISIIDGKGITAFAVKLSWDPYVLQIARDPNGYPFKGVNYSVYIGPYFGSLTNTSKLVVNDLDNSAGIVDMGLLIFTPKLSANGSGVLISINFVCINPGTTSIEIVGPYEGHAWLQTAENPSVSTPHYKVNGIVTEKGPPPFWTEFNFQVSLIAAEAIVPGIILGIIILRRRPKKVSGESVEDELEELL